MKQIAFLESVSWHKVEFWPIKNILGKMTTVASLTHVWVMVDHKLPTQLQRPRKLKTLH